MAQQRPGNALASMAEFKKKYKEEIARKEEEAKKQKEAELLRKQQEEEQRRRQQEQEAAERIRKQQQQQLEEEERRRAAAAAVVAAAAAPAPSSDPPSAASRESSSSSASSSASSSFSARENSISNFKRQYREQLKRKEELRAAAASSSQTTPNSSFTSDASASKRATGNLAVPSSAGDRRSESFEAPSSTGHSRSNSTSSNTSSSLGTPSSLGDRRSGSFEAPSNTSEPGSGSFSNPSLPADGSAVSTSKPEGSEDAARKFRTHQLSKLGKARLDQFVEGAGQRVKHGRTRRTPANDDEKATYFAGGRRVQRKQFIDWAMESGNVEAVFKAYYENDREADLATGLDEYIREKDSEIERFTSEHREQMLLAINQLFEVKEEASSLKQSVVSLNGSLQASGRELLSLMNELTRFRYIVHNINNALERVSRCSSIFKLCQKVQETLSPPLTAEELRGREEALARMDPAMRDKELQEEAIANRCRYYLALKGLHQLAAHLRISQSVFTHDAAQPSTQAGIAAWEITQFISAKLPLFREAIQQRVKKECDGFFTEVERRFEDIGAAATSATAALFAEEDEAALAALRAAAARDDTVDIGDNQRTAFRMAIAGSKGEMGSAKALKKLRDEAVRAEFSLKRELAAALRGRSTSTTSTTDSDSLFDRMGIDFYPLWQCMHIFHTLGLHAEFAEYYVRTRRAQNAQLLAQLESDAVLEAFSEPQRGGAAALTRAMRRLAGFFIVEDAVFQMTAFSEALPNTFKSELWDTSLNAIRRIVRDNLEIAAQRSVLAPLKELAVVTARTLAGYGYDVSPVMSSVDMMRDRNTRIAVRERLPAIRLALESDRYVPLEVREPADYAHLIVANSLQSTAFTYVPNVNEQKLPQMFPFSESVPRLCEIVRTFGDIAYEFDCPNGKFRGVFADDADDYAARATEEIIRVVLEEISSVAKTSPSATIATLVQMAINVQYLGCAAAVRGFESYRAARTIAKGEVSLNIRAVFAYARDDIYVDIIRVVQKNVDRFLDDIGEALPWTPDAVATAPAAREYAVQMMKFLETHFSLIDPLQEFHEKLISETFTYIATKMRSIIASAEPGKGSATVVKQWNRAGARMFSADLAYIEQRAAVAAKGSTELVNDALLELRHLVNLMAADDYLAFLDQRVRKEQYYKLKNVPLVIAVFSKYEKPRGLLGAWGGAWLGGAASKDRDMADQLVKRLTSENELTLAAAALKKVHRLRLEVPQPAA